VANLYEIRMMLYRTAIVRYVPKDAREIELERRDSSSARVPAPKPGHAIVVTRYQEERAVVVHPDDFRRLIELDRALDSLPPVVPSDIALLAHEIEDTPAGNAIEDPDELRALLRLEQAP